MTRTIPSALAVAALLLVPTAAAFWPFDDATAIEIPGVHVGEVLRYNASQLVGVDADAQQVHTTFVVKAEGFGTARDRFGIERAVDTYVIDAGRDGKFTESIRCARLWGGTDVVRRDIIQGAIVTGGTGSTAGPLVVTRSEQEATYTMRSNFLVPCRGTNPFAGVKFRAGDTLAPDALTSVGLVRDIAHVRSLPSETTTFHGRGALRFAFPLDEGWANVTLADGLPGIANLSLVEGGDPSWLELVGFTPGSGASLHEGTSARLPEHNPGSLAPTDAVTLDTQAFGLSYSFEDAFAAIRADPSTCLASFLSAHRDAYLARAMFDATLEDPIARGAATDGGWDLSWWAEGASCDVFSVRVAPSTLLPSATKVVRNYPNDLPLDSAAMTHAARLPAERAPSAMLSKLASAEGLESGSVKFLSLGVTPEPGADAAMRLAIADVPDFGPRASGDYEGKRANFDLARGGLDATESAHGNVDNTLKIEPPSAMAITTRMASLGALQGPSIGEGLGVAALGLTILFLLVKLALIPLFTRLRRATLLDNPLRARLYDRVRAEPGIHRADLIDFAGVGKGATTRHLDQLVRHGFLVALEVDAMSRYYAAGEVPASLARREAILRAGSHRAVFDLYSAEPDVPLRAAARRLGISAPSVYRAKRKLEQAGLLPAATEASVTAAA